jgi:dipeptidyl aminopeptidase/acylaminoacyl peptidase
MGRSDARSSRRSWILGGLAVVVVLLVLVYAGASWFVYDQVGRAPRACWPRDRDNTPVTFTVPVNVDPTLAERYAMPEPQEVRFASRDPQIPDAELAAWWIPAARADAPAVVLVHGVQSCRREANVLLPAGMLHEAGFSVFLMDLRDHGDSGGDDARFAGGSEEYLHVLGGWDWVRAQGVPAERVGILGVSFGAANTVIAGGQEPAVAAVWADSSPTMMGEAIGLFLASQLKDSTGLSKVLVPGALLWARVIAGDDLTKFNPIEQVDAYGGRSIAFVHGEVDPVLPARFAAELHDRAIAAGATSPDPWIVADAGHTEGVYVDPDGYARRVVDFFTGALGGP